MKTLGLITDTSTVNSNYLYSGRNDPSIINIKDKNISDYYKIKRLTIYN